MFQKIEHIRSSDNFFVLRMFKIKEFNIQEKINSLLLARRRELIFRIKKELY